MRKCIYKIKDFYYDTKVFLKHLPFFLKQAWRFRAWDAHFTIDLLCDALDVVAQSLKDDDWHLHARKHWVQCKFASHLIRNAYNEELLWEDASSKNWRNNNKINIVRLPEVGVRVEWERKYSEEYSRKIDAVITARVETIQKQRKIEAWAYLHKHIESFVS